MTTYRPMTAWDLLRFNNINCDSLTETYNNSFYLHYLSKYPLYCYVAESGSERLMGYILGKVEGKDTNWHGHVTALTVAPIYRFLGLATKMMAHLESISESTYNAYYVDLFVRVNNKVAVTMYERMGYRIIRHILGYYSSTIDPSKSGDGDTEATSEDGYDMRKACKRDVLKKSMIPLPHPITPDQLEFS